MMGQQAGDRFDDAWHAHHHLLVDLAFRILGDAGEAEAVAQEALACLAGTAPGEVEDERGWLSVVVSRLCLDRIRSVRARRDRTHDVTGLDSVAQSAQTTPMDPADRITLDDEVQLTLFVLLQRLSPAERVAFVLHDVFQTPFEVIAETLGRPTATCRQFVRRARQKIAATPLRPTEVTRSERRLVTEKFVTACTNGDLDGLLAVLHPQVWTAADIVVGTSVFPRVDRGADSVARNLLRYYGRRSVTLVSHMPPDGSVLLAFVRRELFAVITLTVENRLITEIHVGAGRSEGMVQRRAWS